MMSILSGRWTGLAGLATAALLCTPLTATAQTGRIEGTVREAPTNNPVVGARVFVVGTRLSATTTTGGTYAIESVPAGTVVLRTQMLGYQPSTIGSVQVPSGGSATVNVALQLAAINLGEVVVTGLVGETQKAKLATSVDRVTSDALPVPAVDPATAVQGKVAGAMVTSGSGRPGSVPSILLRGPTSIDASGRSQEPLYVVDGVILGSGMVDLDALDIESIEIVKGAAASSLYGSRAGNGVIAIKTRRGSAVPDQEVHFTVRSEAGTNRLPGRFDLTMHHQFLMNASGTKFIDNTGAACDWLTCKNVVLAGQAMTGVGADTLRNEWNTYQNQTWPGTTYDQVARFFEGGNFAQQYIAAEGRSGSTNFHASWSNVREQGVMTGQQGLWRNTFRVNLDHALAGSFRIGASTFYSRSKQDDRQGALFDLTRMPAGVDLLALNQCPATGTCAPWQQPRILPSGQQDPNDVFLNPDRFNNESPNPLYTMLNGNSFNYRSRFLGNVNARWQPIDWIAFDGNVSYDRLDFNEQSYTFKGYKTITPSLNTNLGNLYRGNALTQNFNADADMTLTRRFGELNSRTQFRYLVEYDDLESTGVTGRRFTVADVPTLANTDPAQFTAGPAANQAALTSVRADGYFGITNLEYKERYIVDALLRNDGSSLFGPDSRRHWYYRLAGAWRVSEDFQIPHIDEFKLRAAYGTAGGRPRFEAQYETYSVSNGQITPATLGNRKLSPEFSKELEIGTDILAGRVGLTVNYAKTTTDNQILLVPLPAFSGFTSQWRNAGSLQSKTWEASLDLQLARRQNLNWSARLLFDRVRQRITRLDVAPFAYGAFGGNGLDVFFARQGEELGTFYGTRYATSCADLLGALPCDQFAVNDDGLLVWVGPGGSLKNPQWGANGPTFGFHGQNRTLAWGSPFIGWGLDPRTGDTTNLLKVGKTTPNFHVGLSSSLSWHNFSLYGLMEWVHGFSVYNVPQQWAVFRGYAGIMDQTGKPQNEQKPIGYYNRLYGVASLTPVNYFVQDASFAKLREVSLSYRLTRSQLAKAGFLRSFQGISLSLIGRNLLTFTKYNGYDPEVGNAGGETGSAAIARVDGYEYPNFRTFTAAITVNY